MSEIDIFVSDIKFLYSNNWIKGTSPSYLVSVPRFIESYASDCILFLFKYNYTFSLASSCLLFFKRDDLASLNLFISSLTWGVFRNHEWSWEICSAISTTTYINIYKKKFNSPLPPHWQIQIPLLIPQSKSC